MARRHSDSETQSCNSLPYTLGADSRDSLVGGEVDGGRGQRGAKDMADHRLRRTQSQEDSRRFRNQQAKGGTEGGCP